MSAPQQDAPPVYGCAAGAVLHAHADATLEPAVLLYTFLPPGAQDRLAAATARVDVHSDGPGSSSVTVRVLSEQHSVSWQLPVAPLVAALPGQPGDDGRMVLLAVVDAEPDPGFWAAPVDCEQLAAELQLPVVDLADALRGRLAPWLAQDVDILLHDDAHEHAADQSPEQTLASAVLRHYRAELDAEHSADRLVRGLQFGSPQFQADLGHQLARALWAAFGAADRTQVAAALAQTAPFDAEAVRLLAELPGLLQGSDEDDGPVLAAQLLAAAAGPAQQEGADGEEAVRAAVQVVARLARTVYGPGLPDAEVLERLGMVDDAGLAGLAGLWVGLAALTAGADPQPEAAAARLAARVLAAGRPAQAWLRDVAATVVRLVQQVPGRRGARVERALHVVAQLAGRPGRPLDDDAVAVLSAVAELGRFLRARTGAGPGSWQHLRAYAAASAVGAAATRDLPGDVAVDLLAELLEDDVEGPDVLEALVCATSQVLVQLDPYAPQELREQQVLHLLGSVPSGPRGARWLLVACLRAAHGHDSSAPDLSALTAGEPAPDLDRLALRAGSRGVLTGGLVALTALAEAFGSEAGLPEGAALSLVLPAALAEHDLLRSPPSLAA